MPNHTKESSPFYLGQLVATPGAIAAMVAAGQDPAALIFRHRSGDWGEVDESDKRANDQALVSGKRVLSAYVLRDQTRVWIITEADRSATTILLPDEY